MNVAPELLDWARVRSGRTVDDLEARFPKIRDWLSGTSKPTQRQLEQFAAATYTPIGMFFLPEPPEEELPIPDYRTVASAGVRSPSADLLEAIYICESRQAWFQQFAEARSYPPVPIVNSLALSTDPLRAARALRDQLGFGLASRTDYPTWTDALSGLSEHAENAGIMVMVSGIVGTNTHRKLDPAEFRGFSLVDELAPVVFVNGADSKAAQIFTLAHELAHVSLGGSGVSRPDLRDTTEPNETEQWCNAVAAELLVPIDSLAQEYRLGADVGAEIQRLARFYKVSTLVILRRVFDARIIDPAEYRLEYDREYERVLAYLERSSSGGNFYNAQPVRTSKKFARAIISDTLEGGTLYRDAYRLLGFKKSSTFDELTQRLGVA